jgi:hypothetical protein
MNPNNEGLPVFYNPTKRLDIFKEALLPFDKLGLIEVKNR